MNQYSINRIGRYMAGTPHDPEHPSYPVFIRETLKQWDRLLQDGWTFGYTWKQPYANSVELFQDLERKRLMVFSGGDSFAPHHPMAAYPVRPNIGYDVSINCIFRAVHDINGHGRAKSDFETFQGELSAYKAHRDMYSEAARPALAGETLGQVCYYFAKGLGGFMPVQKAIALPKELEVLSNELS